jgi:serine/threonine-protein kinase HipA
MALTLNGSTRWPTAKELQRLGETRAGGTPAQIRSILDRIAEAVHSTSADVRAHMKEHPDFEDIGRRMLREWEKTK